MNVYDFDDTIYNGDSSVDFYLYALRKKPTLLCYFPKQLLGIILYMLKRIDKKRFKEYYFSFLSAIDTELLVENFWKENEGKIYNWYLEQKKSDDIIISASPEFLLKPICKRLKIKRLIATKVDLNSGKFMSENCRGQEKVRRLENEYNITHIRKFYSDSTSDLPLARIADEAYMVKKGQINKWEEEK